MKACWSTSHARFSRSGNLYPLHYIVVLSLILLPISSCTGVQSTLSPAGREAETIATLFWWMLSGATVVWLGVAGLALYAAIVPGSDAQDSQSRGSMAKKIIWAGAIVPAVTLFGLLIYGLGVLPDLIRPAPPDSLRISIYGEQWWWRVRYQPAGSTVFETANEIHLPVGRPVEFLLHSNNVIHSFWVPSLAGKKDLIPGRVNRLSLLPTKLGVFRGVCAEYCGTAHSNMAVYVVVQSQAEFDGWLKQQTSSYKTTNLEKPE